MIDMEELRRVARLKGISNMGYAEKDYFQEILMLAISREAPGLVFKGGTALYKFHGLDRFSEDLDFTGSISNKAIDKLASYLLDFGYPTKVKIDRPKSGLLLTFVSEGFLYQGTPQTLGRVQMDISEGEVVSETEWKQFFPAYADIPSFRMRIMALEELMAEKVRAMLVRRKARDAYDIWFLLNKGISPSNDQIQKKLDHYGVELNALLIKDALEEIELIWDKELRSLMAASPDFKNVKKLIDKNLVLIK